LDLELLRRQRELWSIDRSISETWLLVNEYPGEPMIYQWALYYFDFQQRLEETAIIIRRAQANNIIGKWIDFHYSFQLINSGRLQEAEEKLRTMPHYIWQVPANLARILELQGRHREAIEYYEEAYGLTSPRIPASRIQYRISVCHRILGNREESQRALERSLELDPEYLNALIEAERR
jgi:tetratricopeptide (TPR) repeat protein